jgi:hypothetical protein
MIRRQLSRRGLLQGLGIGAAAALPFFRTTPSSALGEQFPKRFVVFFSANEPIGKPYWQMSGPTLPATLPDMLTPLAPFKAKLNMIADLRMVTRDVDPHKGGHTGIGHMLTGRINSVFPNATAEGHYWAGGISLDQYLANKLGVEALTLGAMPGSGSTGAARISYRDKDQPVHPIEDPVKSFDKVFGVLGAAPEEAAKIRAQKQSVLDVVSGDINRLRAKLPSEDRVKLDVHLEHITAIEKQLQETVNITCTPTNPTMPTGYDYRANKFFPTTARLQMDILAQALACGTTQVGSIQLGSSGSSHITPLWSDEGLSVNNSYHNVAHSWNDGTSNLTERMAIEKFHFKLFAYLLEKLDSLPEGEGSVLDNSIVLYAKPIGTKHNPYPMLYILAGGGGGALQTNRYLSFDSKPHNNLLTSICNLMGFDDQKYGDPEICTGALAI